MKKYSLLSVLMMLLSLSAFTQTGTIRGTILDDMGEPSIGATIVVEGTIQGAATDLDGKFSFSLEAGTYKLVASYVGFQNYAVEEVEVKADEVTVLGNIQMKVSSGEDLEEVVVTAKALKNTATAVQAMQRKSINTLDGVSSQTFSRSGDSDAAAAVKRVTGVSVEGGKYVYVRGLSDRYSKTTLNGANIPGLDPNRNTVQLDLFPTNLLDNIIVYKNFTPDLPGDFTGGLININTKDFPEAFTLNFSTSLGINTNVAFKDDFMTYQGGETDWLGVDDGTRDFPEALNNLPDYSEAIVDPAKAELLNKATLALNNTLEPEETTGPMNYGISLSAGNQLMLGKMPLGIIGSLSYSRSAGGYSNGLTQRQNQIGLDPSLLQQKVLEDKRSTEEVLIGALLNLSLKLNNFNKISFSAIRNQTGYSWTRYQVGVQPEQNVDDIFYERTLGFVQRAISVGQLRGSHSIAKDKLNVNWVSSYSVSDMLTPDLRLMNNFEDPSGNKFIQAAADRLPTRFRRQMNEVNFDNKVDFKYNFKNWSGATANLKVGASYLVKERNFKDRNYEYSNEDYANAADFSDLVNEANAFSADNINGIYIQDKTERRNQYSSTMNLLGTYVMTELPLTKKLKSVFGVRLEKAQIRTTGFNPFREGTAAFEDELFLDDLDVLPSAGLIYELLKDKMNLRTSYSRTLARPSFREIAPTAIYDLDEAATKLGNPDLKRTLVDNIDLRWEYFFERGEMVSVSGFYKQFQNPIELSLNPLAGNGNEWQYKNVEAGRLFGIEVEARKNLGFIADVLMDFNAGANFSYIVSKVDIPADELAVLQTVDPNAETTRPLFGQSPYLANAFLSYGKGNTRADVNFNIQGERLYLVLSDVTPDVYEQPFANLNFKVSHAFANGFGLSFSAKNLLNSTLKRTQYSEPIDTEYIFNSFTRGREFSLGLSFKVGE